MESRWQRDASVTLRTNVLSSAILARSKESTILTRLGQFGATGTMQRVRHKITIIAISYGQIRERISASVLPVRFAQPSIDNPLLPREIRKMGRVRRISTYRFVVSLPGTRAGRKEKLRVGIRRIDFYDAALDIDNGMEWNIHKLLYPRNVVGFTVNAAAAFVRDDRSRRRFPRRRRAEQA